MYHCTPPQLAEIDLRKINRHRGIKAAEMKYLEARAEGRATAAKVKSRGR
jgi:hypothetical protein